MFLRICSCLNFVTEPIQCTHGEYNNTIKIRNIQNIKVWRLYTSADSVVVPIWVIWLVYINIIMCIAIDLVTPETVTKIIFSYLSNTIFVVIEIIIILFY